MWQASEKSTRNCFHAKVKGQRVYCAKGHRFKTRNGTLSLRSVLSSKKLFIPCAMCADLDINWEGGERWQYAELGGVDMVSL